MNVSDLWWYAEQRGWMLRAVGRALACGSHGWVVGCPLGQHRHPGPLTWPRAAPIQWQSGWGNIPPGAPRKCIAGVWLSGCIISVIAADTPQPPQNTGKLLLGWWPGCSGGLVYQENVVNIGGYGGSAALKAAHGLGLWRTPGQILLGGSVGVRGYATATEDNHTSIPPRSGNRP
jgi:hypothetical protein